MSIIERLADSIGKVEKPQEPRNEDGAQEAITRLEEMMKVGIIRGFEISMTGFEGLDAGNQIAFMLEERFSGSCRTKGAKTKLMPTLIEAVDAAWSIYQGWKEERKK